MTAALRRIGRFLAPLAISAALLVAVWYLFLAVFPQIGPRVGKTPVDVARYLFSGPASHTARAQLADNLQITVRDAAFGFAAGMVAALVVAVAFVLLPAFEQTFLPVALLLRSVPLVAMTPLIVLVFGRGAGAVAVMAGIVVFFPALVMVTLGLRAAPQQPQELVAAYGGSTWAVLRTVAVPSALPVIFAAARISVPGALIGALVGEWLGSGEGLGSSLIKAIPRYRYSELWASIAAVTMVSILAYAVVGVLENLILARFGPDAGKPVRD